jgi:glutamine synthetase
MKSALNELIEVTNKTKEINDAKALAVHFRDTVKPVMEKLREPADRLEMIVDKKFWPFPSYGDLMFEV